MDGRAFYAQAAEAAATLAVRTTAEGDAAAKVVLVKPFEGQNVGLDCAGRAADDAPRHGSGGAVLVGVNDGGDKACCEGGGGAERDLICPECGKTFLSGKAMYGHLRCHPKRGYKGATRPGTAGPAAALVSGAVKARKVPLTLKEGFLSARPPGMGLKDDLPSTKWPVTARRGRTPTAAYAVSGAPADVLEPTLSEEEEAAMILLAMSSGVAMLEPANLHMQLMHIHAPDAVEGHQMFGQDQLELSDHVADSEAMDLVTETEVRQPMVMPEHAAGTGSGQQAEKPAEVEGIMEPQAPEIEQALLVLEHVAAMVTAAPEVEKTSELESVRDDALVMVCNKKRLVSPAAKKPKKRRLGDLVQTPPNPMPAAEDAEVEPPLRRIPSPASDRKYVCPPCGKSFPTHQALGGHMASHKKVSKLSGEQQLEGRLAVAHTLHNIIAQHHQRQGGAVVPGAIGGLGGIRNIPPPLPAVRDPVLHSCSRCSLIFRSGQALGGHMRKHWFAERQHQEESEAAVASASAVPAALAQAAARRPIVPPRDFDLNELPVE